MKKITFLVLVFLSITLTQAQVPQSERDALIALYNATDGPNWTNNTNWNTSSPVSTWYGITVNNINGQDHVTGISLWHKNLTGSIPAEIGDFPELTYLRLARNNLTGTIPAEIGNLTNLSRLYLYDNNLSGNLPTEIGNLSNLTTLYLYRNNFSGSLPTTIGNLTNLITLHLGGNNFSGNLPASLSNLTNLTGLYLWNNHFSGLFPDISNAINLYNVNITGNNFQLADLESTYAAIKTRCEANGGKYYYNPMNPVDTELSFDMVNGNNYTFNMPTITGTNVTYQWYKNDVPIPGATSQTYNITNAQHSDLGDYTCKAQGSIIPDLTIDRNLIHLYGTVVSGDKAALLAIYNATDGSNWTDHTNWNSTQPVYTWYGVKMRGDRVSEINLNNNNLNGYLPTEIGDLTDLISLDLSFNGNQLSGNIPSEIGNLTKLSMLNIRSNNFTGNIPQEVGNLISLKNIDLGNNDLTGTIPASIGSLINMENFRFENNNFSGNIPSEIGNLNKLVYFDISKNDLTGNIPLSFTNLTRIQFFIVDANQLSGAVPDVFSNWIDLIYFRIGNTYSQTHNQFSGDLDLSHNVLVQYVFFDNQALSTVNIRNGHNNLIRSFRGTNNPNLTCIFVDDAAYSTANWSSGIDPTAHFVETQTECDNLFQTVYVPDDNFENYLETHDASGNIVAIGDQNSMGNGIANDNLVYKSRISNVTHLNVPSLNISDLTGIEEFVSLQTLNCYSNSLTSLSLQNNTALTSLDCYNNQLTYLDLTGNLNLIFFRCFDNNLTNIDMSHNPNLEWATLWGNPIPSIDVTHNPLLKTLKFGNSTINNIDLSQNPHLEVLSFLYTQISNLDLSNNPLIHELVCGDSNLVELDVSNLPNLNSLFCNGNQLTSLDLRNGHNSNIINDNFHAQYNPNLTCIFVDNAAYSTANWTNIDPTAHFVETQAECDALHTPEFDQNLIALYPNPTTDKVYIQNNGLDIKNIEVQNLTGQTVIKSDEPTQIDLSSLSSGMYLIKITSQNDKIGIYKVVKK